MALQAAFLELKGPVWEPAVVERTVFRRREAEAEAERFLHSTRSWGAWWFLFWGQYLVVRPHPAR